MNKKIMFMDEDSIIGVVTDDEEVQTVIKEQATNERNRIRFYKLDEDDYYVNKIIDFDFTGKKTNTPKLPKNAKSAVFDFDYLKQIFNCMSKLEEQPDHVEFTVSNNKPISVKFRIWDNDKNDYKIVEFWVAPMSINFK